MKAAPRISSSCARPAHRHTASFEQSILYEESFSDRSRWDADYAAFARAKVRVAWSYRLDSQQVRDDAPHLLHAGDTLLGGAVYSCTASRSA